MATDDKTIETGTEFAPQFDDRGLIPVVTTDATTGEVLMFAYMNAEALDATLERKEAVYYSRSRAKLWHKGEESGNIQKVRQIMTDCDQDIILLKVDQIGGACCHTGYRTCFYREVESRQELNFTESHKVFDPEKVYARK
jgi:phosphoribosyl-AMP cyclohydrolase